MRISKSRSFEERDSGIELLKIVAIVLIVISHVVQTLYAENRFISYSDYIIDISVPTVNIRNFILVLFSYFGVLGNTIFFVCSAWFLLNSSKYSKRKWIFMFIEIWFVSISILIVTLFITQGDISGEILIKSIFPTISANNWYLTCYLLFYPIHPLLNSIIQKMSKQSLFRVSAALFVLYFCLNFIKRGWFFPSAIIFWITIYFVVAYVKLHMKDFSNSRKKNMILLFVGIGGYVGLAAITNVLGLRISFFYDKVFHWATNTNPFLLAIAIALFNLMRKLKFKNVVINYISSLSLLIYIIHENLILRTYFRPAIWNYIYQNFGYDNLMLWVFLLVAAVFSFGLICSVIYDKTIRYVIRKVSKVVYLLLKEYYIKLETAILKIH